MRRNFCNVLIHGSDLWWFDVGPMDAEGGFAGGWWDPPQLRAELKRFKKIAVESLKCDRSSTAEVAVVCNPETYYYTVCSRSGKDPLTHPLLHDTVHAMFHAGAPFDLVLASDLDLLDYQRYKLYVFLDTFYLDQTARKVIGDKVKKAGHTVLWVYAPGFVDEKGLSVNAMSKLIGMHVDRIAAPHLALVAQAANSPFSSGGAPKTFGVSAPVSPVFAIDDKTVRTRGTIAGTTLCGFAIKNFPDWTSVYTFAPPTSPDLLRAIYRMSKVHIYNTANDVLYANGNYLAITGTTSGSRTIRLPVKANVTDLFSGETLAENSKSFNFQFEAKTTQLFLVTPVH